MIITDPNPELTFGSLNLIGPPSDVVTLGYRIETLATDTDWGNAVPIEQRITSWLQDGAIIALQGYDNREMHLEVLITSEDSAGLALGEQALMLETGKPSLLVWTPPDGIGAPCVFSVVMSHLEHDFDDISELFVERTYRLLIQAEPFVRSSVLTSVTIPAPPASATTTLVDNCTSTSGWAATRKYSNGTAITSVGLSTSGGAVRALTATNPVNAPTRDPERIRLTRTGLSFSIASTKYLRIDITTALAGTGLVGVPKFLVNGTVCTPVANAGRIWWLDPAANGVASTVTSVAVEIAVYGYLFPSGPQTAELAIFDISRSDSANDQNTTNRELYRTLPVAGSARTQASLSLSDAANALGTTLIYTRPSGQGLAQPNLRQYLTSGNSPTPAAGIVSGIYSSLSVKHVFDVPVDLVEPGGHLFLARIKHTAAGSYPLTWAGKSRMGSTDDTGQSGTTTVTLGTDIWTVVTVALLTLPTREMGSDGLVRVELTGTASMLLDEAWIFNIDTGRLTWVECGTASPAAGGSANRIWLDPATVDSPAPSILIGTDADRSDSMGAGEAIRSFGIHDIRPPSVNVFTVTSGSVAAQLAMDHYARFNTHVVDL